MSITVSLNNVADLTNTVTAQGVINTNSAAITTAFTSALNTAGDKMLGNLDMNNQHILNLPVPSSANEPVRLGDVQSGTSISVALPRLTGVVTSTAGVGTVATVFSGTGNLPVSQLAGGTSASSSTFWRGDGTWANVASASITAGAGITVSTASQAVVAINSTVVNSVVNDTNVTGTISTTNALTLGWTSLLPLSRGGINNNPTASAGGQVFSNSTGFAVSTAATTANQIWLSAITGTPVLSTSVWPATCTVNTVLFASATSTWAATSTITQLTITTSTLATPTLTTPTISGTTILANATMSGNLTFAGTGIGIVGSIIGDSATAGNVGELISTTIAAVSAITMDSTGAASAVMGISLTPGDWDITANACYSNSAASIPIFQASFNTTVSANPVAGAFGQYPFPGTATSTMAFWIGPFRTSIAATATYSLISQLTYTGGSVKSWGSLRARRIR